MNTIFTHSVNNLLRGLNIKKNLFFLTLFCAGLFSLTATAQNEFITVWKTDNPTGNQGSNNQSIYFPAIGTNYTIYWEQVGNEANNHQTITVASSSANNPYLLDFGAAGTYRVKASAGSGTLTGFDIYNQENYTNKDPLKLIDVQQWGTTHWTHLQNAFRGCEKMEMTATDAPDLSGITDLNCMFYNCKKFNTNINHWDVSTITNFYAFFSGASLFNQPLNSWDVSNGAHFSGMFSETPFNQNINSWDVSKGTDFSNMFYHNSSFNQPLNSWDVGNSTHFVMMFEGATVFNQPLNNWNVSNGIYFNQMFRDAINFNQPLNSWNLDKGRILRIMFSGAISFNQPLDAWDVSKVEDCSYMFNGATSFNQNLGAWNLVSITDDGGESNYQGLRNMLNSTALSCQNYDSTLIGWANNPNTPSNLKLGAFTLKYGNFEGHDKLTQTKGWTIQDAGYSADCDENSFITVWKTDNEGASANNQIYFPAEGTNYTIYWEKVGSSNTNDTIHVTSSASNHPVLITFPSAGTYKVVANKGAGVLDGFDIFHYGTFTEKDPKKLVEVAQWGTTHWRHLSYAFSHCINMEYTATGAPDLSEVSELFNMFLNCKKFNTNINHWDVSHVARFSQMFQGADIFNQPLNNWDVSKGTDFYGMFRDCKKFNQNISNWDVSKGTNFGNMFADAEDFNQPLNSWDVSEGTNFGHMFNDAAAFNQPLDNWEVGNGTVFSYMFASTDAFNQNIDSWDVSKGKYFDGMFYYTKVFNQPLNSWEVGNGINFKYMFCGTKAFNQPLNNWDVSKGKDFSRMFASTEVFNENISNWQPSSGTGFFAMFESAKAFNQNINAWNVSNGTNFGQMFLGAKVFNQPLDNWNVGNGIKFNNMFRSTTAFNQALNTWDVSKGERFDYMFYYAKAFNQPLNSWDVSKGTEFYRMFHGANSFNQNLGNWDLTSAVDDGRTNNDQTGLREMLNSTALSCQNYDSTLIGWANNPNTPDNLKLGAQNLRYGGGIGAHIVLTETKGWEITGDVYSEDCDEASFITVWKTDNEGTSNNNQVYFQGLGTNYIIYWEEINNPSNNGQKVVTNSTDTANLITFPSAGTYRLVASNGAGNLTGLDFYDSGLSDGDRNKLIDVEQWGTNKWRLLVDAFFRCENMTMSATDAPDLSEVTHLYRMFSGCKKFNTNINHWDVSTIIDFSAMFENTELFNHPLDAWNVSNGIKFNSMFDGAKAFNQNINSWNVSKGTNFESMFLGASAFNQPLNGWNVSKGTNFNYMFKGATIFNQPLNNWNVGQGTQFGGMFTGTQAFNQNINNWDVSKGTYFSEMFSGATAFNQPLNDWDVSKGTYFSNMFERAEAFNQPLNNWDVSKGEAFYAMFKKAASFNQPLNNWDVSKGEAFGSMFKGAVNYNQNLGMWNFTSLIDNSNAIYGGLRKMLDNTALSCENYDSTLIGWANNPNTPNNLTLGAVGLNYGGGIGAHIALIDTKGWEIQGDAYSEDCDEASFITVWKTDNEGASNNNQIYFPAKGTGYSIYWEEVGNTSNHNVMGNVTSGFTTDQDPKLITFPHSGTYKVVACAGTGSLTGFSYYTGSNSTNLKDNKKLLDVNQWGTANWEDLDDAFRDCENMEMSATDKPDLTAVNDLSCMFFNCKKFNTNIDHWDVSTIKNFSVMFYDAATFNQPLNSWDVSQGTSFHAMFSGAKVFNQPLNNWDVSQGTSFSSMFLGAEAFNQNINSWNVGKGINFSHMFFRATAFNQPLNNWDVSKGTAFRSMFSSASAFNQDISSWDVSSGTDFSEMFNNTNVFNQPLNSWDVSNGTDFGYMFSQTGAFNQPLNTWDVSKATDFYGMFSMAESFNQNLGMWNLSSAVDDGRTDNDRTGLRSMLNATALSCANYDSTLIGWANNPNTPSNLKLGASNLKYGNFEGHDKLTQTKGWEIQDAGYSPDCDENSFITVWKTDNEGASDNKSILFPATGTNYTIYWEDVNNPSANHDTLTVASSSSSEPYLLTFPSAGTYRVVANKGAGSLTRFHFPGGINNDEDPLKLKNVQQWGNTHWTDLSDAFYGCENMEMSATDAPDLSGVSSLRRMFKNCKIFNSNINHWDVSTITNFGDMFAQAKAFNQPLNNWDVSNGTQFSQMFTGCKTFNQPLNTWDVGNGTSFSNMFWYAEAFNQNINSWDVSKGEDFSGMFLGAKVFNQPLNSWVVSSGVDFSQMFYMAKAFNQNINSWDVSKGEQFRGMFLGTLVFNQPLNDWNVGSGVNFSQMFWYALAFNQNINSWDVSKGKDFNGMFNSAKAFNQPLNNWDVSSGTNFSNMFASTDIFNQALNTWDVSNGTRFLGMFHSAKAFNQPLNNWDVSSATNLGYMFYGADAFNQDLGAWNLSSVQDNGSDYIGNTGGSSQTGVRFMLQSTAISCENYNATLEGWANNLATPSNLKLGAQGLKYGNISAHQKLITEKGWTITGDTYSADCDENSFITVWKTDNEGASANNKIYFPAIGGRYTIYWEKVGSPADNHGTIVVNSSSASNPYQITFPSAGTYRVVANKLTGVLRGFNIYNQVSFTTKDPKKLVDVEQWGNTNWWYLKDAFHGCENMEMSATDAPDLSGVTDLKRMFSQCKKFNTNINHWDVSTVNNFALMFYLNEQFNQPLDSWDVSSGTDFSSMLYGAKVFNQDINSWDVSKGTDFSAMFFGAEVFNQPLNNWDVSKGTNFYGMFAFAYAFNQNINSWDVSKGEDFAAMFWEAKAFNKPLNSWDVSSGTSFRAMFDDAEAFNQPLNSWDVSNGVDFNSMFNNAIVFNQSLNWNVSKGEDFGAMFNGAKAFNQPLNSWNVSKGTNFSLMFAQADVFNQPLSNWDVSKGTDFSFMFNGASHFDQNLGTWNLASAVDDGRTNNDLTGLRQMLNHTALSCENYTSTLQGWANNSATPSNLQLGAQGLKYGDVEARNALVTGKAWTINGDSYGVSCDPNAFVTVWNTNVSGDPNTTPRVVFPGIGSDYRIYWEDVNDPSINGTLIGNGTAGNPQNIAFPSTGSGTYRIKANGLTGLDHSALGVAKTPEKLIDVEQWGNTHWTSLKFAFQGCENMEMSATDAPDLSGVTSLQHTFSRCSKFNSNINHWDVSNVTNFKWMFQQATKFNQPLDNWDVSNATSFINMFAFAKAFDQNINSWNVSNATDFMGMFIGASSFNKPLNTWDVSKGTNFSYMFEDARSFNQFIDTWDVSKGTNFKSMFRNASLFNQSLKHWDVSKGQYFCSMFENAYSFNQSLANWDLLAGQCEPPLVGMVEGADRAGDQCCGFTKMLDNSGLSCENYNATLIGWAYNTQHTSFAGLDLGVEGLDYGGELAEDARLELQNNSLLILGDNLSQMCAKIAPIELLSFEVSEQADQTVLLEWVSSVEINNDHYTIYRSTDGLNWEFLEEVSGMGNSIVQQSYSLVDNNPYQGANYYRLEQTDYDGTHEELGVRYVYISSSDGAGHIVLSPNPTRDRIHVRGDYGDVRSLQLINVLGQNVMSQVNQQIQAKDHLLLDLSSLPAGTYILKTEHSNFKIIKK